MGIIGACGPGNRSGIDELSGHVTEMVARLGSCPTAQGRLDLPPVPP